MTRGSRIRTLKLGTLNTFYGHEFLWNDSMLGKHFRFKGSGINVSLWRRGRVGALLKLTFTPMVLPSPSQCQAWTWNLPLPRPLPPGPPTKVFRAPRHQMEQRSPKMHNSEEDVVEGKRAFVEEPKWLRAWHLSDCPDCKPGP